MGRYLDAAPVAALLIAAMLAGCHPAAAPANSVPAPPAANAAAAPAAPAAAASSADAADVKTFLDGVYAHYKTSTNNTYQPLDKNAPEVFDSEMIALMKADTAANKGEVGALDSDTICECQDWVSIRATVAVQSATPTAATATAILTDTGMTDDKPRKSTFDLVKTPAGWRIHDIHTADDPSMRKDLQDDIVAAKKLPANAF